MWKSVLWVWVSNWGHVCRGNGLWVEVSFMGTSGTGTDIWRPEVSWMNPLTMHLLSHPVVYLKMGRPNWLKHIGDSISGVQHLCRWNLYSWPRSPVRVGWVKVDSMGNYKRPGVILNKDIRSPRIRRWVRKNSRCGWRAVSYGPCQGPFPNLRTSLCTFSNAPGSRAAKDLSR